MKIHHLLLILGITASSLIGGEVQMREAYTKVHEAKDIEAFSRLIEFSYDTPEWIRAQVIESFKGDSSLKVTAIEFTPIPLDFRSSFEYEGVTYVSTLAPQAIMKVSFAIEGQGKSKITATNYTIGEKDGIWRIISAKPKK
jgi:hypothetical protein